MCPLSHLPGDEAHAKRAESSVAGDNTNKPYNNVWHFFNAFGMMIVVSILFVFCCLPVFTIGPACTALYYTIVKVIRRDRDTVLSAFFQSFKNNFQQALSLNLLFLTYFGIVAFICLRGLPVDWKAAHEPNTMMYICIGLTLLVGWMPLYAYPALSRFHYSNRQILRFTLAVGVRCFYITLPLLVLLLITAAFSVLRPVFLIITPALYALAATFLLEPIFKKYSKQDGSENYSLWYGKNDV